MINLFKSGKKGKETTLKLSAMSASDELKLSQDQIDLIFRNLLVLSTTKYAEDDKVHIPYLGDLKIEYIGDKILDGCKEAELSITLEASPLLKRIIGQIANKEMTDIETYYHNKNLVAFQEELDK